MKARDIIVRFFKKGYQLLNKKEFALIDCDDDRQSVNTKIFDLLSSDRSYMITRFGTTELICVNNYLCITSELPYFKKVFNFITDKTHTPWWFEDNFKYMSLYSGIFPPTKLIAERFALRYLKDIPEIDVLGSFQYYEKFMPLKDDVQYVHLEALYPFFVERPWTKALEGKKVLVVHPFEETIKYQYSNRHLLFENPGVLPDFELIVLKAVQSVGGLPVPYKDWFDALSFMEDEISKIDFDICLLGCGAYGLPLAAHVKRMGKKAIHLGGGLQLLFGIKGNRWDSADYGKVYNKPNLMSIPYCSLYNDFWIRPLSEDTPSIARKVEGGSYW